MITVGNTIRVNQLVFAGPSPLALIVMKTLSEEIFQPAGCRSGPATVRCQRCQQGGKLFKEGENVTVSMSPVLASERPKKNCIRCGRQTN